MGIKEFEPLVVAALPGVLAAIPGEPAAQLGRFAWRENERRASRERGRRRPRAQAALDEVGDLLAERVLGALELTVDRLVVGTPADLLAGLPPITATSYGIGSTGSTAVDTAPTGNTPADSTPADNTVEISTLAGIPMNAVPALVAVPDPGVSDSALPDVVNAGRALFGIATIGGGTSAARTGASLVEQVHPGASDLVVELMEALLDKASVPDAAGSEQEIAAQHGAAHLALAIVVSTAVLRGLGTAVAGEASAIIGVALGAVVTVLPGVPKPPGYAAAVLAKRQAEYLFPQWSSASARVTGNQFWLTEGSIPAAADFSANGLVTAAPDGVVIRTGMADGQVRLTVNVLAEPPDAVELNHWDEVVEISWIAPRGGAVLSGATSDRHRPRCETPPWPGDYRIRVHATARDDSADRDGADESYQLVVWQAPTTEALVHKATDRLGHRLRGESEPPQVVAPEAEYRWVTRSSLSEAATVTLVRGLSADEVIRAFGGDPAAPVPLAPDASSFFRMDYHLPQKVAVLAVDDVVIAVEENGFRGADLETVKALSRKGVAGSVYWNVNGNFQFTVATRGTVAFAGDPRVQPAPYTEGMDFADYRHRTAKGLAALARFIGRGITEDDLAVIHLADESYVLP
ncbi:DUF6461 domain-containing protein [Actinokineospora globicatena]|uniref:DUF6461 domain-containing protein n=1 Tax=Actinokineospora globicatena TaxID=103729 RepID=UPI0020A3DFF0|nr:DUF6461 domain-containing protein [Actinokineospora globicatena]MCP2306002.1 hypothetical protein [Actinokineospora globicatena]GLW80126.1 hypothetical protein Aglo01_46070 [Actinokineospora globicatena]GLW86955.1 hypothetical protein Aglo02_45940 [Actinokineospora globicatena]